MPTIFSHAVVPIATGLGLGQKVSKQVIILSAFCALLPDIDTIGFKFGVPYGAAWGHRGDTHSMVFALAAALIAAVFAKKLNCHFYITFFMVFVATISHGHTRYVHQRWARRGIVLAIFNPALIF